MKLYLKYKKQKKQIDDLSETVKAIEKVAAVNMQKVKKTIFAIDNYSEQLDRIISEIISEEKNLKHSFINQHDDTNLPKILVVISQNKGLTGGLNEKLLEFTKSFKYKTLISIGKEVVKSNYKYPLLDDYSPLASQITQQLIDLFNKERSEIKVIYNKFSSFSDINPVSENFLPISLQPDGLVSSFPVYEPSKKAATSFLIQKYLDTFFLKSLQNAKLSEYASRVISMESAENKAKNESIKKNHLFLKGRSRAMTQSQMENFVGHII